MQKESKLSEKTERRQGKEDPEKRKIDKLNGNSGIAVEVKLRNGRSGERACPDREGGKKARDRPRRTKDVKRRRRKEKTRRRKRNNRKTKRSGGGNTRIEKETGRAGRRTREDIPRDKSRGRGK